MKAITLILTTLTWLFSQSVKAVEPETLSFDGIKRTYIAYIPKNFDKSHASPLIFVLHGAGSTAKEMFSFSNFNALADVDTCIIVYPDAYKENWNDGRYEEGKHPAHQKVIINDVGYIDALITLFQKDYNADSSRVFVTGISNGAIMAYRLGCELSHRLTAIAPVVGNASEGVFNNCRPVRPTSIMVINGENGQVIPQLKIINSEKSKEAKSYASVNKSLTEEIPSLTVKRDRSEGNVIINSDADPASVICVAKETCSCKNSVNTYHSNRNTNQSALKEEEIINTIWNFFMSEGK